MTYAVLMAICVSVFLLMWLKDISGEGRAYGFFFMPLAFWTVFVIACLIAALLHRTASAFRPK